jgi:hypothetical protein
MSYRFLSRVLVGVVASLAVAACLTSMAQAEFVTVADWQFNDGALLVDSSGNGHTLAVGGTTVTQSGGNAVFSGAGWLQAALDLRGYRQVKVSYGVNVTSSLDAYPAMFEQNTPFYNNFGSIFTHMGPGTAGTSNYCGYYPADSCNYNIANYTSVKAADYVVTYDLDKNDGINHSSTMNEVYINGSLASTKTGTNPLLNPTKFATGIFSIGARNDGTLNMSGTMSYFKIEAQTPEPGTIVLLSTGLIGLLAYAWRKRK